MLQVNSTLIFSLLNTESWNVAKPFLDKLVVAAVCLSFLQSIVDSFQHLGLPLFNGNPVRFNGNCAANQVQALVLLGNPG